MNKKQHFFFASFNKIRRLNTTVLHAQTLLPTEAFQNGSGINLLDCKAYNETGTKRCDRHTGGRISPKHVFPNPRMRQDRRVIHTDGHHQSTVLSQINI